MQRRAELVKALPDGAGKKALQAALDAHARSLAYYEDRRLRKVLDWASVWTIIFLLVFTTVATIFLWPIQIWLVRAFVVGLDVFVALLLLVGVKQVYRYDLGYRHDVQKEKLDLETEKQARRRAAREEKASDRNPPIGGKQRRPKSRDSDKSPHQT